MYHLPEQDRDQLMMRATECLHEGSPIEDKIKMARHMYDSWSEQLKREPHIHQLIEKLEGCLENSREAMLELGIVETCTHCDEEEGGSCCGSGIENKYDAVLLLINLLLGVSLENQEPSKNSCSFLGKKGCTLTARHVLCVNYICQKLQKKLNREELIALQTCAGEELDTLFILHEAIKKKMRT